MRSNLLVPFLELLGQQCRVRCLPVPFLESACWVYGALFLPVHCLPWPAVCLVLSQPNPCLDLQPECSECSLLVELPLVPNSKTLKVLVRQSRVLLQVLRRHLNPAFFPCFELQLANLLLLVTHPFLGSHPSSLRTLSGVLSRVQPRKLLPQLALWVQLQGHWSGPSRWPI
jgi:hypothetical protein